MAKFTYDHIHLRSPNPDATAQYYERMFGAEVVRTMQQGKPRIDLKLGGVNIFIAPVAPGDGVNPPPTTPYQGLDHFGLSVSGIDAVVAELKAKGAEFTREPTTVRPGVRSRLPARAGRGVDRAVGSQRVVKAVLRCQRSDVRDQMSEIRCQEMSDVEICGIRHLTS